MNKINKEDFQTLLEIQRSMDLNDVVDAKQLLRHLILKIENNYTKGD